MCKCVKRNVSVNICMCVFMCVCLCMPVCLCTYDNIHTHIHSLSVVAFLNIFPSTLLKHENEIDSLGLKDGTAETNNCCQLPWQVSTDNGLVEPNGTIAMFFSSNFLTNICSFLLGLCACVCVSVILT